MDALDKLAFSFPTMVRALLRLLPKALTAELDLRTLRRLPTTHVGPGLRQRHADMPWRIACRPAAGRPPWPHVLLTLEFQATVDRHMALRVETYTALLRQDLLREGRRLAGPNRELPRVLPVVVYTGRERWRAPLGVRALTAPGPEALASLQPEAACVLLDGPALPDEDVRRNLAAALIAVQSCAEASRIPERVAGLLGLLRRTGDAELGKALRDGLRRMLETRFGGELPRRWMEEPMTLEHRMDEWEQEWFRQGREEGRAEVLQALQARQTGANGADVEEPMTLEHRMDEWEQEWFRQGREEGRAEVLQALQARQTGADGADTEEPTTLEHRMDEWEQEWFRQGREEGIRRGRDEGRAEERALLLRLTARRFGAETAEALGRLLEGVDDTDRLAEVGEMIVDCRTGGELLDRAGRA